MRKPSICKQLSETHGRGGQGRRIWKPYDIAQKSKAHVKLGSSYISQLTLHGDLDFSETIEWDSSSHFSLEVCVQMPWAGMSSGLEGLACCWEGWEPVWLGAAHRKTFAANLCHTWNQSRLLSWDSKSNIGVWQLVLLMCFWEFPISAASGWYLWQGWELLKHCTCPLTYMHEEENSLCCKDHGDGWRIFSH